MCVQITASITFLPLLTDPCESLCGCLYMWHLSQ